MSDLTIQPPVGKARTRRPLGVLDTNTTTALPHRTPLTTIPKLQPAQQKPSSSKPTTSLPLEKPIQLDSPRVLSSAEILKTREPSSSNSRNLTIRAHLGIKQAFEATPPALRDLEKGWRQKRKMNLDSGYGVISIPACTSSPSSKARQISLAGNARFSSERPSKESRRQVSFADQKLLETPIPRVGRLVKHNIEEHLPRKDQKGVMDPSHRSDRSDKADTTREATSRNIQPILASPLTASPYPLPITKSSFDTIHIHPNDDIEIRLMVSQQIIELTRGGRRMVIITDAGENEGKKRDTLTKRMKSIDMKDVERWSEKESAQWHLVARLVEEYERRTTRIKVYHTLGILCLTCSTTPDIILTFGMTTPPLAATGTHSSTKKKYSKIRIAYSRSHLSLRIDVSTRTTQILDPNKDLKELPSVKPCRAGQESRNETYRTRRILSTDTTSTGLGPVDRRQADDTENIFEAGRYFGLDTSIEDWTMEEREALRRLWLLREEWQRF